MVATVEEVKKINQVNIQVRFSCSIVNSELKMNGSYFIEIDGKEPYPETDVFDYKAFQKSLQSPEKQFVFTCSCGESSCSGRRQGVEIILNGNIIRMKDLDYEAEWFFDKENVLYQIEELNSEVSNFIEKFKKKGIKYSI